MAGGAKDKNPKVDKAKVEAKKKAMEDKTFGLKNKNKSSKVQKYVAGLQVTQAAKRTVAELSVKDKKKAEEERQKELNALFAVAIKQPKVPPGVDPKSIVCEFFRHGQCTKGFKCKFSHDLSVERRGPKIDLFTDQRDVEKEGEGTMEEWDQETLEKVVNEKHGKEAPNKTDIICKFFLDAVERNLYGWFWKCPNGEDCKYRHALPPGYVLKSQMKQMLEDAAKDKRDMTEVIEEERAKVDAKTPITEQTFRLWHSSKSNARKKKKEEDEAERRRKGLLNGREIFLQEGFEATDDASAADEYNREDDEEAKIRAMMEKAAEEARNAREAKSQEHEEPSTSSHIGNGTTSSAAADGEAGPSTTLKLGEEDAALFMEDEDEMDDEEDMDDDDDDDDDLDGLEEHVRATHLATEDGEG